MTHIGTLTGMLKGNGTDVTLSIQIKDGIFIEVL